MIYCGNLQSIAVVSLLLFLSCTTILAAVRVVTLDELQTKNGKDSNEMWLSILGEVYDVSEGKQYYGEGSPYNIFLGRDASASFVTGNFTEAGAKQSLLELDPPVKLTQLDDWKKFYEDSDKYHFVGVLEGDLYDKDGKPTDEMTKVQERIAEGRAERERKKAETDRKIKERKEKDAAKKEAEKVGEL
ncbi:hypothetical protein MPSEU_000231100 [Mayamaea pseudoterrestris]|nr:hypothetical protein MPSEU_000231100 [Mayamaea pseudoterrestris]